MKDRNGAVRDSIDLGELANSIGYLLTRAQRLATAELAERLGRLGLRPLTFATLTVIQGNPGRKQSDIADALAVQRTNFVGVVDELLKKKWIERVAVDRRSYALHITPAGAAVLKAATRERETSERSWDHMFSPDDKADFVARLRAVIDASPAAPAANG